MSAEFSTLAEVLAKHYPVHDPYGHISGTVPGSVAVYDCFCGEPCNVAFDDVLKHQADAWREARTIRTVEQLDALLDRSIIRAGTNGHAYEKSMLFTLIGRRWMEAGNGSPECSEDIGLPALLLWHPDWSKS